MASSLAALRGRQAHVLFGLHQGRADLGDFAGEFLAAASNSGFNEDKLKVIFNSCLDEPLKPAEMRMLRPHNES